MCVGYTDENTYLLSEDKQVKIKTHLKISYEYTLNPGGKNKHPKLCNLMHKEPLYMRVAFCNKIN